MGEGKDCIALAGQSCTMNCSSTDQGSVPDPDPDPDPDPPGSEIIWPQGSGSEIRYPVFISDPDPAPDPDPPIFHTKLKNMF